MNCMLMREKLEIFPLREKNIYVRANYREPRLLAKYIPKAVGPEGCIWLKAKVRGN